MFLLKFVFLLNFTLKVIALFTEDLQSMFAEKHCIEASLISLPTENNEKTVFLDSHNVEEDSNIIRTVGNFDKTAISKIHELAQYNGIEFLYKLISEEGPPHSKTYIVQLKIGDEIHEGAGSSLKRAKQEAAIVALSNTSYQLPPEKIKDEEQKSQTPTVILNNVAMKLGIAVQYFLLNGYEEESLDSLGFDDKAFGKSKALHPNINSSSDPLKIPVEDPQKTGPFTVRVKVGEYAFKGLGHTIQAARHDAALQALKFMQKEALFRDNTCSKDDSLEDCKQKKDSLKSPISRVYETAQKHNLNVEFNIISESGLSHKKVFVIQCKVADYTTEGEGSSKKESKKLAAEKMLHYLSKLPAIYDEKSIINGLSSKKKKKKKKKMIRENIPSLMGSVAQAVSSFFDGSDENSKGDNLPRTKPQTYNPKSAKNKILEIGAKLDISIEFTDLQKYQNSFFSLIALGVKPPHMCLGKASDRQAAHDAAALYALKFLHKSGALKKLDLTANEKSDWLEELELDDQVVYDVSEDVKEEL